MCGDPQGPEMTITGTTPGQFHSIWAKMALFGKNRENRWKKGHLDQNGPKRVKNV